MAAHVGVGGWRETEWIRRIGKEKEKRTGGLQIFIRKSVIAGKESPGVGGSGLFT